MQTREARGTVNRAKCAARHSQVKLPEPHEGTGVLKELLQLENPSALVKALMSVHLLEKNGWLKCSNCRVWIKKAHMGYHDCPEASWAKIEYDERLTYLADLPKSPRRCCRLCKMFWAEGEPHPCQIVSRVFYDRTAITDDLESWLQDHDLANGLRTYQGHWTIEYKPPNQNLRFRSEVLIAPSDVPGAGLGMFAIGSLDPSQARDECLYTPVTTTAQYCAAYLSQTLIGVFTGVVTKEQDTNAADTARVYSIQLTGQQFLDQNNAGSILYRINQAHGSACNLCACKVKDACYAFVVSKVKPGQELFWDYNTSTDNPNYPELGVPCHCQGTRRTKVPIWGAAYGEFSMRGCTGRLVELK